jgi:hypothetical protein
VAHFLAELEQDPYPSEKTSVGPGFPNRYFQFLAHTPVVVTWLIADEICVVTLLRLENVPG